MYNIYVIIHIGRQKGEGSGLYLIGTESQNFVRLYEIFVRADTSKARKRDACEMPIARVSLNSLRWITTCESEPRHRNMRTRTRLDAQIARGTADSCHCTDATRRRAVDACTDAAVTKYSLFQHRRLFLSNYDTARARRPVLSNYDGEISPAFSRWYLHSEAVRCDDMHLSLSLSHRSSLLFLP